MERVVVIFILSITTCSYAQNIVPNYSFEDTLSCDFPIISNAPPWFNPTDNSPDYWNEYGWFSLYQVPNNLFGYQPARTGHAYAGIEARGNINPPGQREYIEVALDSPLVANKKYCVQFYVNLSDSSGYATDGMGAYSSTDSVIDNTWLNLLYTPQISNPAGNILTDKVNWTLISGEYIASGGEKFITIGNFKDDANSQTQYVGPGGVWLQWCYYFIEDVYVGECDTIVAVNESSISIPNIFTPNNDGINDEFKIICNNVTTLNCKIYNRWGILVGELTTPNEVWQGRTTSGMEASGGVYYFVLTATGSDNKEYNEKGFVQLLR